MPEIGFGTWQLQGEECVNSVQTALEVGYRHIDTADVYQNHKEVKKGIERCGIDRNEFFLTSKVWRENLEPSQIEKDLDRFLNELGTEYLDLLLIHWPNDSVDMVDSLIKMNDLKVKGLINHIGISNFSINQINEILESIQHNENEDFSIYNHQYEFHPSLNQQGLLNYCQDRLIKVSAYSPLAQGNDLGLEVIRDISEKYKVSPAIIILSWIMHKSVIPIVRSSNKNHIEENFRSIDFDLSDEDVKRIDRYNGDNRIVNPSFADWT